MLIFAEQQSRALHVSCGSFAPIPLVRPTHARSAAPPIAGIKLTPNDRYSVPGEDMPLRAPIKGA